MTCVRKAAKARPVGLATTEYRQRRVVSIPNRKVPPRPANREARTTAPCLTWADYAALAMLALAMQLQGSIHLSVLERQGGWAVFGALLNRFVDAQHSQAGMEGL